MSEAPVLLRLTVCADPVLGFVDLDLSSAAAEDGPAGLCLVGPNASGKSALLARLHEACSGVPPLPGREGWLLAKFRGEQGEFYVARAAGEEPLRWHAGIEDEALFVRLRERAPSFHELGETFSAHRAGPETGAPPAPPAVWGDPERALVDGRPAEELVSFLSRRRREREEALQAMLRDPANRARTIAEVERLFEQDSPQALAPLREAWGRLLAPAGIAVDFAGPEGPFLDRGGRAVPPLRFSGALRAALWHSGLAVSLAAAGSGAPHFFLDLPECGLHRAIAAELASLYRSLAGSEPARLFVATHSPQVAACFPPARRLRLERDAGGALGVSPGVAPAGAPLGEFLGSDFGVGGTRPARVPEPPREIPMSEEDELADLIDEVISIRKFPGGR